MNNLPIKINFDLKKYSDMLEWIMRISAGDVNPDILELQIRELQSIIPIIPSFASWMAVAMQKVSDDMTEETATNPVLLREFLINNSVLDQSRGALTALLCVAEEIKALNEVPKVKEQKRVSRGNLQKKKKK